MTDKSNNLFENLDTVKEYRWIVWLIFLTLIIAKDFIKSTILSFIYNMIIICIMSILGIYVTYQFIEYMKKNDNYDIKDRKRVLIGNILTILATVIYLVSLLVV